MQACAKPLALFCLAFGSSYLMGVFFFMGRRSMCPQSLQARQQGALLGGQRGRWVSALSAAHHVTEKKAWDTPRGCATPHPMATGANNASAFPLQFHPAGKRCFHLWKGARTTWGLWLPGGILVPLPCLIYQVSPA